MYALLFVLSTADHLAMGAPVRPFPADSAACWALVDARAEAWAPLAMAHGSDATRAGAWDVPRLLSLISPDGVDAHDANGPHSWHSSLKQLAIELRTRAAPSVATLLHLGYIRADRPEIVVW